MTEIIGVRFKELGKVYSFDPHGTPVQLGQKVIVETARGIELGEVALANKMVEDSEIVSPLKGLVRVATEEDLRRAEQHRQKEKEAFAICSECIEKHDIDMHLVDAEYTFDGAKLMFYFTSDGRVDFRELLKELARIFRTRIDLRQIGVRDEAKMLGGIGICGRPFCCSSFLEEFQPVSIKMAKEQSLSLNPMKISGACGRLMCCLKYEQAAYEDLTKRTGRPRRRHGGHAPAGARQSAPRFGAGSTARRISGKRLQNPAEIPRRLRQNRKRSGLSCCRRIRQVIKQL